MENEINSPEDASVMAIHPPKTVTKVGAESEEWGDHQSEASSMESVITKHINDEGKVRLDRRTKSSYDVDELEKIPESQLVENSELMKDSTITPDKATNIKESNEDKALQTLQSTEPVPVVTVDESMQEEKINTEAESVVTDTKVEKIPENDFEEKLKVLKGFGLLEVTHQTSVKNELKAAFQSETQNREMTFINNLNLEGETTEITLTNDTEEQEKVSVSYSAEKLEINNDGNFTQEQAKEMEEENEMQLQKTASESGVTEYRTLQTLAYVGAEAFDKSIQKEIPDEELEVTTTKEGQVPENFEQKLKVPKAFGLNQVTHQTGAENELPAETQFEVQNQENTNIKHPNLEEETTKVNPTNDTEEQEKVQASHTGEQLENNDDGKFKQEKAKGTEEATEMKLLETATESPPADEVHSTMPTSAMVKGDIEEIVKQQTLHNYETAVIDTDRSCRKENKLEDDGKFDQEEAKGNEEATKTQLPNTATEKEEVQQKLLTPAIDQGGTVQILQQQTLLHDDESINNAKTYTPDNELRRMSTVVQVPDQPDTEHNVSIVKDETADHQIEGSSTQSVITNYITEEELLRSECSSKVSDDVDEQKTEESHGVKNLENKDASKIPADEATDDKQLTDMEIQKSETEGVTEDKALQTLHNTATVEIKAVDESSQEEIQQEKVVQTPQHECDAKRDISEEETWQLSAENEQKSKCQAPIQKEETTFTNHPYSDGETAEINPTNETEEQEEVQPSHAKENLLIRDGEKVDQEEGKEIEDATKMQLLNTEAESPAEEEVQPKLPTPAIVQRDINEIIQQEPLHDDESEGIDKAKTCIAENKLEGMSTVVEEPDQPETKDNDGIAKEEQADHQSEGSNMQSVITNYRTEDRILTSESSTKLSDDVDERKTEESHEIENFENRDASKISAAEATDAKQFTDVEIQNSKIEGVLKDKAPQILHHAALVEDEAIDESSHEEIQKGEVQTPQHELDAKTEIAEEETCQLRAANEPKSESQPAVENEVTTFVKHLYSDGHTAKINPTKDTEEQEEIQASYANENLLIQNGEKVDQEKAKGIEEATNTESLDTKAECPAEKEVQPKLPTPAIVQCDTNEIIQQETLQGDESEGIDKVKTCIAENKLEGMSTVVEEPDQPETKDNDSVVKEEQADRQSEGSSMQSVIINYRTEEGILTLESSTKLSDDVAAQKTEESHKVENFENRDASKVSEDEEADAKQFTDVEIQNSETEAMVKKEAVDESSQDEIQQEEVQTPQYEFDAKRDIHEEETCKLSAANQKKTESQPAVQNEETTFVKHLYLDGETTDANHTNDTQEKEFHASHAKENLLIKDGETVNQEEAKGTEEATNTQLLNTDAECPAEEEDQPKLPSTAIVQHDTDEIIWRQTFQPTLHDDESEGVDKAKTCIAENKSEGMSNAVEETDQPENKENNNIVKEQADHPSEGSSIQNAITDYIKQEGNLTSESSTKLSDDVDEQKTEESHGVENFENKDASKISADAKQFTDVEIQNSETEGVPQDKALQTLQNAPPVQNEAVKSSQEEIQQREEVQTPQYEFDAKRDISEEVTYQLSTANDQKSDSQHAVQNEETTFVNHPYSDGETAGINPTNDTDQKEEVQASHSKEYLLIKDGEKVDQEIAKVIDEAKKTQLLGTEAKWPAEEEVQPKLSTPTIVQHDTDEIIELETLHYDKSEGIDKVKPCIDEKKLEGMSTVVEEPDQPDTEDNVSIVKDEQTDHQSEGSSMQSVITNYMTGKGILTSESGTKLGDDVDEQKTEESHWVENYRNRDAGKISAEEAADSKQFTDVEIPNSKIAGVPEDKAPQTSQKAPPIQNEAVDKISHKEIQQGKEVPTPQYEFHAKRDISEEETCQLSTANEQKSESQHAVQNEETTFVNHPYLDGETEGINPTNDTDEKEDVQASHTKEYLLIGDGEKVDQEVAKVIDEAKKTQLLRAEAKRPTEEEVQPKLPTPAIVQYDTNEIIQKETLHDDESEGIDKAKPCIAKNKLERMSTVVEEPDQAETEDNVSIVKEEQADHQSEGSCKHNVITNYMTEEGILTSESSTKLGDDVDEQKMEESHRVENFGNGDAGKIFAEEAADAKQFTDVEIPNSKTEVKEKYNHDFDKRKKKVNQEQAKGIEEEPNMKLLDTEAESLAEEEIQPKLPTPAIVQRDTDEIKQQHTLHDDELEGIDKAKTCIACNRLEGMSTVLEEPDQPDTEDNVGIVKEEQAHNNSEGSSKQSVITNYITEEGILTSESSTELSDDVAEQKTKESRGLKNFKNRDASNLSADEATDAKQFTDVEIQNSETEGVPEDKVPQTLHNAPMVKNEAVDESSKDDIQQEEVQTPHYEFHVKRDIHEKQTCQLSAENEQKSESQPAVQKEETKSIKHLHLDEETVETKPTNDTEEQEEVQTSHTKENLLFEDGKKVSQEEAEGIEEATKMQLNTEAQSPAEEEIQPELSTPAIIQRDTDEIIQKHTLHDDESEGTCIAKKDDDESEGTCIAKKDDDESEGTCIAKNELEGMSIVVEEPDQPDTEDNVGIVKGEQADHQSKGSSMQSVITNYITEEGILTSESSTKLGDDVDEQKTEESHRVENFGNRDASKISAEEAADAKQFPDVEIPYSETQGEPKDKDLQTLHTAPSVENEAVNESIQEEIQQEVRNEETTFVQHPFSDGETIEINPTNDAEEQEEIRASYAKENFLIKDGKKVNQEQAKGIEEATNTKLLDTEAESPAEEEVQPKLPTPAILQCDTDEIIQQQTFHNDESEGIQKAKTCIPKNKLEGMSTVVKEPDQPETKNNFGIVKEQSDHQSKGSSMQSVITNYRTEGFLASEISTKLSDSVYEQTTEESHWVENFENKDATNISADEATDAKQFSDVEIQNSETKGVPEDNAPQTLDNAASVQNKAVDESSQEIQQEEEVQTAQYEFDAKGDILEEETCQLTVQNEETTFIKHPYSDGDTAEMKPTNDTKEQEQVQASHSKENLLIEDGEKVDQEEAKGIEQATKMQFLNTDAESPAEEEVQPQLLTPAIVQRDTDEIIHQQTLHDDESEGIDNAKTCIPENKLEALSTVVEEPDQPETKANVSIVIEAQADHQSEGSSIQNVITDYITAEGFVTSDSSNKLNYDVDEQKMVDSYSGDNLENKYVSKITAEEATDAKQLTDVEIQNSEIKGVPEDKSLQTLPNEALVQNKAVDESSHEEIQPEEEFAVPVTYTKDVQTSQYEFDAKKDFPEEETCQLIAENKQKPESQPALQNEETTFIKHLYLDGETEEINPTNDIEEQGKFSAFHATKKLVIEDDGMFDQEEAKEIEEAAKLQLLSTATESAPEEGIQPKFHTPAIVQGHTEQILQQQTLHDNESEAIDNANSCIPENELERTSIVVEDPNQPEAVANVGKVKEGQADHQSEALSMQSAITNYINAEGLVTSESITKLSYDVDEQKTVNSHSMENLESKDASRIIPEGPTDIKQLTGVELQNSENRSVHEDKALQTLPSTASVGIEEVVESIHEIHTEAELTVIDTTEGLISENYSEAKEGVSENMLEKAFDLHKVTCQTSVGSEQRAELLSKQQSQETTVTKHPNLEGETTEINLTNETEEREKVPTSHTREKLEINDDGNFIQEEEKEMEKATERQLLKTEKESEPEGEAQTTLPTSTFVKCETVERIVQEQTLEEEESAAIDNNNSGRPENERGETAKVVETIDQHETMAKVSAENEEHANHKSEQSRMENVITKHINSEGMVTTENSTKSSYDVEELEKVLDSDSIDNSEIEDGGKIMPEEPSEKKEATGLELQKPEIESVPEDKAISTLSTIPSVRVEIVEESIQEEIKREAEPAVTNTKEGQRPKNDCVKNLEVLEAFDLHKGPANTCVESEKKAEVQSEAKSQETMIIKHPNLEGQETVEINPRNDTKEREKEHEIAKPRGVSEPVYADITEQTDTGKLETQEAETTQLGSTKEDEGDEFEKISPSSSVTVKSRDSEDNDTKVLHKKSHGILSGVGSKVKHSISKVKKAITGKSSHQKSPKEHVTR